jgi:hypothetical protein
MKYNNQITILSLTALATLLSTGKMFVISQQPALAETVAKTNLQRVVFLPPKDARPKSSTGGASRDTGKCPSDSLASSPYLTAVIPNQDKGLTTQASPTLLVYLPDTSAGKAFFSISEVNSDHQHPDSHYQTFLPIQPESGVMQINLPEEAPELEVGKTYKWSFVIMCDNRLRPDSPMVEGMIERVSVNAELNQKLETATPLEQAMLYGQEGLWYDSVSILAKLQQTDPNNPDLTSIWADLLSSEAVGLSEIVSKPILNK